MGKSGRDMLDALVAGTKDPVVLADLARGKLRAKIPALQAALKGRFGPVHAVVVGEILAHLDYIDESLERLQAAIDEHIVPFAEARDRLCTIPGVDTRLAEGILAEVGADMSVFPTAAHLASWAGMCPGNHESAGKSKRGTARAGNSWLQRNLTIAAMAASRTKGTYLSAQYSRLVRRHGKRRARKAVGHTILIGVWHILAEGATWNELGGDYFQRRDDPARVALRKLADLRSLGWPWTPQPRAPSFSNHLRLESFHFRTRGGTITHSSRADDRIRP